MTNTKAALICTKLRNAAAAGADRSFVTFILEPLYKLTSAVVGEHPKTIERLLGDEFGIHLKSSAYSQDVKPLLKEVSKRSLASVCLRSVSPCCV
jgi:U5 small nuclear ribonucleoprotein component